MSSQSNYMSSVLFQNINDDLNASLATADELSREFNSMLMEASSNDTNASSQTGSDFHREKLQSSSGSSNGSSSSQTLSPTRVRDQTPMDSIFSPNIPPSPVTFGPNIPPSPIISSPRSSPKLRSSHSPVPRSPADGFPFGPPSPRSSPRSRRRASPTYYERSSYLERSPSPSASGPFQPSQNHLSPYDTQMGRRSPRPDRSASPLSMSYQSNTLPRNFGFRQPDEGVQRLKSPGKWNETDLDVSYAKKSHRTHDKSDWTRPSVPNSSWRESNLDGPPPSPSPKKDPRFQSLQFSHGSLPRNARIAMPPEAPPPYHTQPIVSRISIPPTSAGSRQHRPIPLSVIMRLQNPQWGGMAAPPRGQEGDMTPYQPREFHIQPPKPPPELRQPDVYSDVLVSGEVDAELERLDVVRPLPVVSPSMPQGGQEAPRPLSPTRLQPVVAPQAQSQEIPNLEELLLIRAQIPRALKRRGSVDPQQPLKPASHYQPNQYKHLIGKLFRRKEARHKGEPGSEYSSSSDGEDCAMPPPPLPQAPSAIAHDFKSYRSILRRSSRERRGSGKRARLSPLVLLLDGSLVGELETVQKAVQEMSDPSQPNDEGITALHNAICGGHYPVVDFLVRIGANPSAPDSHGWTPLHCAASCNDRALCEFLVRNGAAVMAMTHSDGTTAAQKCDPYAVGFEDCENFLRSAEEAMGLENSGVLYALWSYPAQAADELSFKEGDMLTILQKPEGSDWWWASLCGREGFVPVNYFGLFPKIRPKSLC